MTDILYFLAGGFIMFFWAFMFALAKYLSREKNNV